jgi:hypothetical protein
MDDTTECADLPLWAAEYDGNADIDDVTLFGGWTRASARQWAEKLLSGAGLDQSGMTGPVRRRGRSLHRCCRSLGDLLG